MFVYRNHSVFTIHLAHRCTAADREGLLLTEIFAFRLCPVPHLNLADRKGTRPIRTSSEVHFSLNLNRFSGKISYKSNLRCPHAASAST